LYLGDVILSRNESFLRLPSHKSGCLQVIDRSTFRFKGVNIPLDRDVFTVQFELHFYGELAPAKRAYNVMET
jgi:hypothetical protein